ncbi:MAG: hypothetical protein ABEK16_04990 [Candidatus Nanohalobium sp.]
MPNRTRSDIREACRSLAVKCPTAATFLALRAVEDRLRYWYEKEEGKSIEEEAWGQVLDKMEKIYDEKESPPVMANLQFLKSKRNDVSHPDESPNMSEAETTILRVRGTITEIYEELSYGQEADEDSPSLSRNEDIEAEELPEPEELVAKAKDFEINFVDESDNP